MKTSNQVTTPAVAPLPQEWLRVSEACAFARVSKPVLYAWMNAGLIKSFSNRERGQIKGTRLVSYDSLRTFLESRATGGDAQA
ncbi:MAG: helix-turn-helix domain-containing protein [Roseimicrobium sp.]